MKPNRRATVEVGICDRRLRLCPPFSKEKRPLTFEERVDKMLLAGRRWLQQSGVGGVVNAGASVHVLIGADQGRVAVRLQRRSVGAEGYAAAAGVAVAVAVATGAAARRRSEPAQRERTQPQDVGQLRHGRDDDRFLLAVDLVDAADICHDSRVRTTIAGRRRRRLRSRRGRRVTDASVRLAGHPEARQKVGHFLLGECSKKRDEYADGDARIT